MMLNSFVVEPDVLYLLLRFAGQNLYIDIKTYVVGIRVSIQLYQGNVESSYRTLFELKGEQLPSSY